MYFPIECFSCGCQIGYLYYRYYFARVINFSNNSGKIIKLLGKIIKESGDKWQSILDFILESAIHFDAFQTLDVKQGVQCLVKQYNDIYDYPEKQLDDATMKGILDSRDIAELFTLLHIDFSRGGQQKDIIDDQDQQAKNTIYMFLKENNIWRMCCRNTILTFADFYEAKQAI